MIGRSSVQSGTKFRRSMLTALQARRCVVERALQDLQSAIERCEENQTSEAEVETLRQAWEEQKQEFLGLSSRIRTLEQVEIEARTEALGVSFNRRAASRRSFTTQRP